MVVVGWVRVSQLFILLRATIITTTVAAHIVQERAKTLGEAAVIGFTVGAQHRAKVAHFKVFESGGGFFAGGGPTHSFFVR